MLDRQVAGYDPETIAADKSYGTGPFLSWLLERKITPYIPVLDRKAQTFGKFTHDAFEYDAINDLYVCPQDHQLPFKSINENRRVRQRHANAVTARSKTNARLHQRVPSCG